MADHEETTFEVIEELLMDKTIKFSMLAGKWPVLGRVKNELTKYWKREAKKGRSIEEVARFKNVLIFLILCLHAGFMATVRWQTLSSMKGKGELEKFHYCCFGREMRNVCALL